MSEAQVISLGCRLNISESEQIRAMVSAERDLVVVNSCAVTSEAVRQTRQAIRRARRANPDARLLVTGCAAEIERGQIAAMPEVDGLVANTAKLDPRAWNVPSEAPPAPQDRTRAFIAVQNGCDHACTFCVIPQGRGPSRSLSIAQVLAEVERHLDFGAREVVLTGVDVTSWGHDLPGTPPLGDLVRAVLDTFPQLERLRMSSLDGIEIDPLLFELFAYEQRLMPHLHLSLQHGHDLILKRMKRRHLRGDAVDLIARLRELRRDLAVGADLIAGFPTETDAHHAANLSIVRELKIVHGHIFPGGADYGLAMAIKAGLIRGPRLFYSGRALTQTGGHADFRALEDHSAFCFCGQGSHIFGVIADGVPAVQQAAREELRRGATQIKIMASGGVASPSDPIWNLQYSEDEIRAIVWEATSWRTYVMAHAYTPEAIARCVEYGVRSIEHANLIDEPTAALCAAEGAFVVPTLVTYDALHRFGPDLGLPAVSQEKLKAVRAAGLTSLEILKAAGVTVGFGTDLLGEMQAHQSGEFLIRAEVLPAAEILRSATSVNAALLNAEGELGVVAEGALADLIVVDGDPLADLSLLQDQGSHLPLIMKAGGFIKRNALQ